MEVLLMKITNLVLEIIVVVAFCFVMSGVTSCSTFPTTYDRVDHDMVRTLDFMYEPAEAAPGDSVTMIAVFSGEEFDVNSIDWTISTKISVNNYGVKTALNELPLNPIVEPYEFSPNTQAVRIRFKLPETILLESPIIPDNLGKLFAGAQQDNIPSVAESFTKKQLLDFIEYTASNVPRWRSLLETEMSEQQLIASDTSYALYKQALAPHLPLLLQLLTVPIEIYADIPGEPRIRSTYSVRYNSHFTGLPDRVYANNNPIIEEIGVYKVAAPFLQTFDPENTKHRFEYYPLHGEGDTDSLGRPFGDPVTVIVDSGYSYFVGGMCEEPDSVITIDVANNGGKALQEHLRPQWYFELDSKEVKEVSPYDYMNIVNMGTVIAPLYPAEDDRVKTATIWLEVFDDVLNELFHPYGSTLKEVRVRFEYTGRYIKNLKK